ncbi:MAG: nuclease-related domain-containing protein [Jatrophihabitantaceae bacterium]
MINSRSDRRRRRQLAGDDRTSVWNRRQNREQRLHVLRSNRWSFIGAVAVGGAVIAGVAVVIPWQFARGLFVGVGASALVVMIGYLVLALSGTVARGMGATAEMWTASELRRLRKHRWLVVNGLALQGRDIDHVLVGPGGVIVVESKWSAEGWDLRTPSQALTKAVDQVVANARSLRLWTAVKASGAPVTSVVVLWGGNRTGSPERPSEPVELSETTVAFGLNAVRHWVNAIAHRPDVVSDASAENVWRELDRLVAKREDQDRTAAPPASIDQMLWTVVATAIAFIATLLGCLETYSQTKSWWLFLATLTLLLSACLLLRRRPIARTPAAGGLAGVAVASTLAAVSAILTIIG